MAVTMKTSTIEHLIYHIDIKKEVLNEFSSQRLKRETSGSWYRGLESSPKSLDHLFNLS